MDKDEAREILNERIGALRGLPYERLLELRSPVHQTVEAPSGAAYQVEVQAFWDDRRSKNVRVMVLVDDGGLRALVPMSDSFIVRPDGSFAGE